MATKLSKIADENVRTAWVKKWTMQFLGGLQGLKTRDEIESYCLEQKAAFEAEVKRLSEEKAKNQGKEAYLYKLDECRCLSYVTDS